MGGEGADDIHAWIGPVRSHCGSCSHSCLASTRGDVNGDETIKNPPDAAREMGRSDGTTASGASAVPSCDWGAHKRIRPLPNRKLAADERNTPQEEARRINEKIQAPKFYVQ